MSFSPLDAAKKNGFLSWIFYPQNFEIDTPLIFQTFKIFLDPHRFKWSNIFDSETDRFCLGSFWASDWSFWAIKKSLPFWLSTVTFDIHEYTLAWQYVDKNWSLPDSKPKTFFVTLSQPVSECHRISIWRVTVSRLETSLSKCRTSFLKTIEHTLQQQNVISLLNSDAPGMSFLSKFSWAFSSIKFT